MLLRDIRYAVRSLLRSPGFALAAVLTLALGIGANTAVFSLLYGVLLKPLPYADDQELVVLRQHEPNVGLENVPFSIPEFFDLRERSRGFEDVVEYHAMTFTLLGREEPERVSTGVVSARFFDLLGVTPVEGRTFVESDEGAGAEAVLMLSHEYWQRSFGGDPAIVGEVFEMNDRPHTVVGILPPIPQFPNEHDVYMPSVACPFRARSERQVAEDRNAFRALTVLARMGDDQQLEGVRAELTTLGEHFRGEHPDVYTEERGYVLSAVPLKEELVEQARPALWVLLATAFLVLLLSCANVANLTVARLLGRERELAVRVSMGAGRGVLVRQTLTESLVLAFAGAGLGLGFAYLGLDLLKSFLGRFTPRVVDVKLDLWVLAFTVGVAFVCALLAGALPALTTRFSTVASLREGGQSTAGLSRLRLRSLLLAAQVALAVMLLVGAGLLLRSFWQLQRVDPGFDPERVLSAQIALNWSKYTTREDIVGFYGRLMESLESHPGVVSAGAGNYLPLSSQQPSNAAFVIEGEALLENDPRPQLDLRTVTPGYFRTLGVPLVNGRLFDSRDHAEAPAVALINQSLAARYWPDRDPIGRRVSLDDGEHWMTVVGVVGDIRQYGLDQEASDELYRPLEQGGFVGRILVRTRAEPTAMARELKQALWSIDPDQPISSIETLEEVRRSSIASPRVVTMLLSLFALLALVVTTTGIGSVLAYSVSQRTQEIGIRMALGAPARRVRWMVLGQGLVIVCTGLAIGLLGSVLFGRLLSDNLFQTSPRDPATMTVVTVVLLFAAVVACWLPARRATRIEPTVALRAD